MVNVAREPLHGEVEIDDSEAGGICLNLRLMCDHNISCPAETTV
jgi:hypothetical protein